MYLTKLNPKYLVEKLDRPISLNTVDIVIDIMGV